MRSAFSRISELVSCDRSGRVVSVLNRPTFWKRAVEKLKPSRRVAIVTGFMVPDTNSPETDGPPGAVILGRAILRSGRECTIFTDPLCYEAVSLCSDSVKGPLVTSVTSSAGISEWLPDMVIFIERLGRAGDGRYYNMRCRDITEYTLPLDEILLHPEKGKFSAIAIGDGGNEAGLGLLKDRIVELIPEFANCVSVTEADIALPVDVSNWGAYALAVLLSISESMWLGHSLPEEELMLRSLIKCGAVDGVTKLASLSVDGFSLEYEEEILSSLKNVYYDSISK